MLKRRFEPLPVGSSTVLRDRMEPAIELPGLPVSKGEAPKLQLAQALRLEVVPEGGTKRHGLLFPLLR